MKILLLSVFVLTSSTVFACPTINGSYRHKAGGRALYLQIETDISPENIFTYSVVTQIGTPNKMVYIADGQPRMNTRGENQTVTCANQELEVKSEYINPRPNPSCGDTVGSKYMAYAKFIQNGQRVRRTISYFSFCANGHQYDHQVSDVVFESYLGRKPNN